MTWRRLVVPVALIMGACILQRDRLGKRKQLRKKPELSDWENEGGAPRPVDVPPESANAAP
jgi:hypothetical protein